jgi:cytochrome c553
MRWIPLIFVVFWSTAAAVRADAPPSDADLQFFENKIRPVLVERCYKCHSEKEGKDKGGLLVDSRSALLKGGDNGPSLVPGKPDESILIQAITYANQDLQMPPKGKLPDAQIADLKEWVRRGAPWPAEQSTGGGRGPAFDIQRLKAEHWCWQPPAQVSPPAVKLAPASADAIDQFLLAALEQKGIRPADRADPRTLLRRVSFALTGLPPSPEEVDAFVAEGGSPAALSAAVDRLLASPHFGERWGRHWLDLVRYAETRGHEFDYLIPDAWRYRDYVIRALNDDVPYNQFLTEHVAGDLLRKPRLDKAGVANESVLATGFWFMNEWVHSPVDIRQDECDRVDNQVDVFGKAFLGLTIGCARCHDHKFDAISARDYYALVGFLHSSSYRDVRFEHQARNADIARRLADFDSAEGKKLLSALSAQMLSAMPADRLSKHLVAAAKALRGEKVDLAAAGLDKTVHDAWLAALKQARKDASHPLHTLALRADEKAARPATPVIQPREDEWTTVIDYRTAAGGARSAEWIVDGYAFGDGPRPTLSLVPNSKADQPITAIGDGATAVGYVLPNLPGMLRTPTFTITKPRLSMFVRGVGSAFICIDSHRMLHGPLHGVSKQILKSPDDWRVHSADLSGYIGQRAHIEFTPTDPASPLMIRWVKQGDQPASPENLSPTVAGLTAMPAGDDPASLDELAKAYAAAFAASLQAVGNPAAGKADVALLEWLLRRPALAGLAGPTPAAVAAFDRFTIGRQALVRQAMPSATAMAMLDGSPVDERLLIRGLHKTPGAVVPRRGLEAIDGTDAIQAERGSGRLQLAERLIDPRNPLVARVYVNRVWHHLFGRGIVASTDNFGVLGDKPTHPELLDYLANEFVRDGWSTKRLIKRIILTDAWQRSSKPADPAAEQADPQNLLLHRQNLRRLDAEVIRDQMLAISGRLDPTLFGPSVEVHLTSFMDGRGKPGGSGPLDGSGRRSIYTRVRRNFLPPMLLAFDFPQPFNTMGKRTVSNVPAQALILMNDPFVIEQSKLWIKRLSADPKLAGPEQRIDRMYRQAFARPPTEAETRSAIEFVTEQAAGREVPEDKRLADARAWEDLAHVLMNVKEFVYVP